MIACQFSLQSSTMTSFYFFISSVVTTKTILDFFGQKLQLLVDDFFVVEDYVDYLIACGDKDIEPTDKYVVEVQQLKGAFDWHIEFYMGEHAFWADEASFMALMRELVAFCATPVLVADDDIDPYTFWMVKPTGAIHLIALEVDAYDKEDDPTLVVEGYYSYDKNFGHFVAKEAWQTAWLEDILRPLFAPTFQLSQVMYYQAMLPIDQTSPPHSQKLRAYYHHYTLMHQAPISWVSTKQKYALLKENLLAFAEKEQLDICWFPAEANRAITYDKGVTYEKSCWCYEQGKLAKIVYKLPDFKR